MSSPARLETVSLPILMGLRFLLSLWILANHVNHITMDFFHLPYVWLLWSNSGYYAVDLFFMLSGIVITHHYGQSLSNFNLRAYGAFLWLRFARLYPVHLLTLLMMVVLVLGARYTGYHFNRPTDYSVGKFIENLFLVQAWHYKADMSWNYFAWSISAEWFAYLICPLLFWLLVRPLTTRHMILISAGLLCIIPVMRMLHLFADDQSVQLLRVVVAFSVGICMYRTARQVNHVAQNCYIPFVLFFGALYIENGFHLRNAGFALFPAALVMYNLLRSDLNQGSYGQWMRTFWAQYCGNLAYAFYMVQYVLIMIANKIWPHTTYNNASFVVRLAYIIVLLAILLLTSIVIYHAVEQPARAWLRQRNPFVQRGSDVKAK